MWGYGKARAGNEGLTDHSTRNLYSTVAPLQTAFENAGKDEESLSGPAVLPPGRFRRCQRQRLVSILVGKSVCRFSQKFYRSFFHAEEK